MAAATVESRTMLPSFMYLGLEHEAKSGAFDVPWAAGRISPWANTHGAKGPKSQIEPWARPSHGSVTARSIGASRSCPGTPRPRCPRSRRLWPRSESGTSGSGLGNAFSDAPLAEQYVVLTVPASFDASARDLTREAALAAGLPQDLVLLEEPQAAVYAWLAATGERWRKLLQVGDTLLVCDVGGGTTDLTLVGLSEEQNELALRRIAVGNHLLVGGDNMDLALAHYAAGLFAEKGVNLDPWQSVALWHSCRAAKEILLRPAVRKNTALPCWAGVEK